ncbi:MAG TPA: 2-phosphosulfolactate phosphatase [Acetobacteraceae bacterium]
MTGAVEIRIESLIDGARRAAGTVAVIDVLRAFTTAAVAFENGATRIIMVADVEEALRLRARGIGQICMGEVKGRAPEAFDFGNSPFELSGADLHGKTIIQRTSAGTQGIVAASGAERCYAAALVTAGATARAMLATRPACMTLVAMGLDGGSRTDEDELCALHLRNLLQGRPGDAEAVRRLVRAGGEAMKYRDASRRHLHPEDLDIAVDVDRYDFAIRVDIEDGRPAAWRENPAS